MKIISVILPIVSSLSLNTVQETTGSIQPGPSTAGYLEPSAVSVPDSEGDSSHDKDQELDPEVNVTEDEFLEHFHLPKITDPAEKKKRAEALKKAQDIVRKQNKAFLEGNSTWFDAINEFSDLPLDEFKKTKTGLLEPTGAERVDAPSERYFAAIRMNRANVPDSYDSRDADLVSPVKDQKLCGSCVAFAHMALVETCFKKLTGVFGDYSEQQMIDCAYGHKYQAYGCKTAYYHSYIEWVTETGVDLAAEATYPYKGQLQSCPASLDHYNQGAKVSDHYYTYDGDEETLKRLVAQHGAVVTSVASKGPFRLYSGGVFAGCIPGQGTDHAVTVVGYGHDSASGMDYWIIKNSWGTWWGEDGYIRLQRGVGMCGIGRVLVTVDCTAVPGPTDPPLTTEAPCEDFWTNCADLATDYCFRPHISQRCPRSCGLCPGQTPAASNTCYDEWSNCADLCRVGNYATTKCRKACGNC